MFTGRFYIVLLRIYPSILCGTAMNKTPYPLIHIALNAMPTMQAKFTGRLSQMAAVPKITPDETWERKHHKQSEGDHEKFPILLMHRPCLRFKHIGQDAC